MKQLFFLLFGILVILLQTACQSKIDKQLDMPLSLAGDNRKEMEKILDHYKNDPEKLAAARFLIMNMPGHSGVNQSNLHKN